ncbi:MAG: hypothetical protein SFT68_00440 [Rickettsiaceae bacterium]|nr:hypothetical protein [Rickettsiaceae bacterium]
MNNTRENIITRFHKSATPSLLLILLLCLSSCSTYSSKFACGDSRGAPCLMLRNIDKQIDSGEIEKAYAVKSIGITCKKESNQGLMGPNFVSPKSSPIIAKLQHIDNQEEVIIKNQDKNLLSQDDHEQ